MGLNLLGLNQSTHQARSAPCGLCQPHPGVTDKSKQLTHFIILMHTGLLQFDWLF
jgi:hypothetical protein